MGGLVGALRGGLAGAAEAAGAPQAAQSLEDANDRARQEKQNKIKMQVAPLSLALQGYKARFNDAADPNDPSKPAPGKEAEYHAAHDGMAAVIGKIRALISPPPKEDPHGLSLLEHTLTDKLHITRHAVEEAKKAQKGKVDAYNKKTADTAQAIEQGNIPFAMTPEGRKEAAALELQRVKNEGQKDRAGNTRAVPYYPGAMNLTTAKSLAEQGKTYLDENGDEIDLAKLPADTILVPVYQGTRSFWQPATDKGRYETGDNRRKFEPAVGGPNPNAPDVGAARVPTVRSSSSTDPFGVTTTSQSTSTPMGSAAPPAPQPTTQAAGTSSPAAPPVGPKTKKLQQVRSTSATASRQLDENGHIPESDEKNSMLRTAANQLLDGMDISKLGVPQRDRQAAAHLASQYGWSQGGFTPRELTQVQESRDLIRKIQKDPKGLEVYWANPLKRGIISQLIRGGSEKTFKGSIKETLAANMLSENEITFIQNYRQLIGRIQGLAQLTRGSGRPTEAAVKRMMAELPDPAIVRTPAEAKHSFDLIENEIQVALKGAAPKNARQLQSDTPKLTAADLEKALE